MIFKTKNYLNVGVINFLYIYICSLNKMEFFVGFLTSYSFSSM